MRTSPVPDLCGWAAVASALAIAVGCNAVLGFDEGEPAVAVGGAGGAGGAGGDEGGAGLTGTGGHGACCADAPPLGWEGPAVLYTGDDGPPICTGPWADGPTGGIGIDAPLTPCACECGAPSATCSADLSVWDNNQCAGSPAGTTVLTETCTNFAPGTIYAISSGLLTDSASCPPNALSEPTPAQLAQAAQLCRSLEPEPCGPGLCDDQLPPGYPARKCVYRSGEHACPESSYTEAMTLVDGIDDQRACDCGCDAATITCTGALTWHDDPSCQGADQSAAFGSCVNVYINTIASISVASQATGACTPVSNPVVGTAEGTSPVTVCCEPGS